MGIKYSTFRILYEIKKRSGYLLKKFPNKTDYNYRFTIEDWKKKEIGFINPDDNDFPLNENEKEDLEIQFKDIINGKIKFFGCRVFDLGTDYDWVTNPLTGFQYDKNTHWSKISDIDKNAGDIKYVWEKSRFSYLLTVMRYDKHFKTDNSRFVFNEIDDFIHHNPLNLGPNYICSQEISIRILNWLILLQFYKNSSHLTEKLLNKILKSILLQANHVHDNINFSRYSVRNNHVIVESALLMIIGKLFPEFDNSSKFYRKGKKVFIQEVNYQIYADGTYLQFSHNYHRLVVQILTIMIAFSNSYFIRLPQKIYDKAYDSLKFLYYCQDPVSGHLPNYGANDGALIFPLNGQDFRDFRPQLDVMHKMLTTKDLYPETFEDRSWISIEDNKCQNYNPLKRAEGIFRFDNGGIYVIREENTITTLVNTKYKDRPSHADALHLDIWHKGENVLTDAGSFTYNADEDVIRYYFGTASHNTIMIENKDHMLKGSRFIWYYWIRKNKIEINEDNENYTITLAVNAYRYLKRNIYLKRQLVKVKHHNKWIINDEIQNMPSNYKMLQIWHTYLRENVFSSNGEINISESPVSEYYGTCKEIPQITFIRNDSKIKTTIEI